MVNNVDYIVSIGDCCVPSELCVSNRVKKDKLVGEGIISDGLIFDWAISNLEAVCDITQNGFAWYLQNTINDQKWYDTSYKYKKVYWPHHKTNQEYKEIIGKRYFSILEQNNVSIVFLYMSATSVLQKDLIKLDSIIKNNYQINHKIVAAISSNVEKYTKINEFIDLFECNSPAPFVNNKMKDDIYYKELFNRLIPYSLTNLKLI